jgi:hypothetical protein
LESCLLHLYFTRARVAALRAVTAACGGGPGAAPLPLAPLASQLGCADVAELEALAEHHGLQLVNVNGEVRYPINPPMPSAAVAPAS